MAASAADEADAAWCEQQRLPSLALPVMQQYLHGRDALVAQEKTQRSDRAFRDGMSPVARHAAAVISAIRRREEQTLWSPAGDDGITHPAGDDGIAHPDDGIARPGDGIAHPAGQPIYPGMMFSLAKHRMQRSTLWQLLRRMPKGALLHCHLYATGDVDWLIDAAFATPGMCIVADASLHTAEIRHDHTIPFVFKFATAQATSTGPPIWSASYTPGDRVPVAAAADSFPEGSTAGFRKWVKSRMTLSAKDAISHHLGPHDIWSRFIACFGVIKGLANYEPIFRGFVRQVLRGLHSDGIKWVDLRCDYVTGFTSQGNDEPDPDYTRWFEILDDEIEAFKSSDHGKGFWGASVIWTSIRQLSPKCIMQDMQACIDMKLRFPDLVLGYDLVGHEDTGRPLLDLTRELFWFKKRCAEEGVDLPFFFHAGETLGDGDRVDENLFDAILLGTRRIGHAISLYRHPLLIELVKEKNILIESCPVSNEVLRYTGNIKMNPLPALLARGVSCCLANDDPAILGHVSTGLTHDFWQALHGWDNLGLAGLASLAENSVRWATFEESTTQEWRHDIRDGASGNGVRAQRMREWRAEFEQWCAWVVEQFGPALEGHGLA